MSGRCKACNAILKENEMKWREDIKQHEDLCIKCRSSVYDLSVDDIEVIDDLEGEGL
jgi:hypothetical protein